MTYTNRDTFVLGIGAMKAASTTLHRDLEETFRLRMLPKEGGLLHLDSKSDPELREMLNSKDGEVVASYSMTPEIPSIASRAQHVLRDRDAKIIYLVRDPVQRILSHIHHDMGIGRIDEASAWKSDSRFLSYSSYRRQYDIWEAHFGHENICVLPFEEYVDPGSDALRVIATFLGREVAPDASPVHVNASSNKRSARGPVRKLISSNAYRQIRSRTPAALVDIGKSMLLSDAPADKPTFSSEDEAYIRKVLHWEVAGIAEVTRIRAKWMNDATA